MKLSVKALTPERWPDLEALFAAKGCSMARGCWCMYYRISGRRALRPGHTSGESNRVDLKALVDAGTFTGLIGYRGKLPVGWVALGPREHYKKLERSPVTQGIDRPPAWSIVCFVVPSPYRGQGVATALLAGAVAFAKRNGAELVEAYPVDKALRGDDQFMWPGAKSMYDRAGFEEVARRKPNRPVVRLRPA